MRNVRLCDVAHCVDLDWDASPSNWIARLIVHAAVRHDVIPWNDIVLHRNISTKIAKMLNWPVYLCGKWIVRWWIWPEQVHCPLQVRDKHFQDGHWSVEWVFDAWFSVSFDSWWPIASAPLDQLRRHDWWCHEFHSKIHSFVDKSRWRRSCECFDHSIRRRFSCAL